MGRLKVGIIGCGLAWERLHYPAFQELADKYELERSAIATRK